MDKDGQTPLLEFQHDMRLSGSKGRPILPQGTACVYALWRHARGCQLPQKGHLLTCAPREPF